MRSKVKKIAIIEYLLYFCSIKEKSGSPVKEKSGSPVVQSSE